MAASSSGWEKIKKCGAGSQTILVTGDVWDTIVDAMNAFAAMDINPRANVAVWRMTPDAAMLDLSSVDDRLRALETATGVVGNTIVNVGVNPTLYDQVQNIVYRLDHATANANCVANTVVVTFTI